MAQDQVAAQLVLDLPSSKKCKENPTQNSLEGPRPSGRSQGAWEGAEARRLARNSDLNKDVSKLGYLGWGREYPMADNGFPQALPLTQLFICSPSFLLLFVQQPSPLESNQHPYSLKGLLCARPWAHHCPGPHGPWKGRKRVDAWLRAFTQSVYVLEFSTVGARTTGMTKAHSSCSRLRLAEDRSGNSCFQPQTAVRMVNRKRRESTLGPQRAPLSVCLVIHLCHQPPVNEHVQPGRCWEQPGDYGEGRLCEGQITLEPFPGRGRARGRDCRCVRLRSG